MNLLLLGTGNYITQVAKASTLVQELAKLTVGADNVDIVVCPTFTALAPVATALKRY